MHVLLTLLVGTAAASRVIPTEDTFVDLGDPEQPAETTRMINNRNTLAPIRYAAVPTQDGGVEHQSIGLKFTLIGLALIFFIACVILGELASY